MKGRTNLANACFVIYCNAGFMTSSLFKTQHPLPVQDDYSAAQNDPHLSASLRQRSRLISERFSNEYLSNKLELRDLVPMMLLRGSALHLLLAENSDQVNTAVGTEAIALHLRIRKVWNYIFHIHVCYQEKWLKRYIVSTLASRKLHTLKHAISRF